MTGNTIIAGVGAAPLVLTPGVTLFGAIVAFAFLYTFDKAFRALFSPLLTRVANINFGPSRFVPDFHPFGFLNAVVESVESWTKSGMAASQRAMSWSITTLRSSIHELALTAQSMAHNYALAFDAVWHGIKHAVPRVVRQTIVRPVQKAAAYSDAKLRAAVHQLTARVDHLAARVGHLTHATAGAIAAPFPRIGRLEKDMANALGNLRKLGLLKNYKTLAALGVAVAAKIGLSWARCSRSKKFGDKLCHSNANWIEDFFLGTVLLLGSYSFHEFVEDAQEGFDLGLEGLQLFIREFKDLPIPKS